jgi:LacI family transcriptional regulator
MRLAVQHLLELGHCKIAYANAPDTRLDGHSSVAERHQTYLNQMSQLELSPIAGHDRPLTSAVDFINEAVISHGATAVISYGHMNALNIMQAAHSLGLAIPQDFSLICFCDEYAANVMSPNLTFIDLQSRKMGNVASEMLLTQTSSREKLQPKHIKLQEKLVVRETTAEPRVR